MSPTGEYDQVLKNSKILKSNSSWLCTQQIIKKCHFFFDFCLLKFGLFYSTFWNFDIPKHSVFVSIHRLLEIFSKGVSKTKSDNEWLCPYQHQFDIGIISLSLSKKELNKMEPSKKRRPLQSIAKFFHKSGKKQGGKGGGEIVQQVQHPPQHAKDQNPPGNTQKGNWKTNTNQRKGKIILRSYNSMFRLILLAWNYWP